MVRVNRVSVSIGDEYDPAIISLYRTNTKLAEITSEQLEIPLMCEVPDVSKVKYQQYCKDLVIHLLERGGIQGYYWEPKKVQTDADGKELVRKFNKSAFRQEAMNRLSAMLDQMEIQYKINQYADDTVDVTEKYKDGNIKYGTTNIIVTVGQHNITVPFELKSGQMCKPKTFVLDSTTYSLNTTNIKKL